MKKSLILLVVSFILLPAASAFSHDTHSQNTHGVSAKNGNLIVVIDGFKNDKGAAKIALCNSEESYKTEEKTFLSKKVRIINGKAEYVFKRIPWGNYAIIAYHDENGNDKLDKSFIGKPIELYGFSNNARGIISKPSYNDAAFDLDRADMTVTIHVE